MDKLANYRTCIQKLITNYASYSANQDDIEAQTIFDTEHDHYQLMYVGWNNQRRIYGPVLHFDIKDGKIWIQWNGTEDQVATQLVEMGVPKHDIVLGFHAPYNRQYTDFAVG